MLRRLQRAWGATEHPFLARVGGLGVAVTLVTGGAAVIAGFVAGVIALAAAFPTWVLVVILVGLFLMAWGALALVAERWNRAKRLPDDLRDFAKRLGSDRIAQAAGAPAVRAPPGPKIGNQTPEQDRYRLEYEREQRRRDRYFAGMTLGTRAASASRR